MNQPLVSCIVPVFNGECYLAEALDSILAQQHQPLEVIVVDDGSTDGTAAALTALKSEIPQLRVLRHGRNLGQSRSIRSGVQAARGDIIITLDGDGQNDPADIPKLLAALEPDVAMVSGVRVKRKDTASRRLASRLGNRLRSALLGDGATDTGCGLKVFRRSVFLDLPYFDHLHRFLIALVLREGWKVNYVPVNHRPRLTGTSKYTNFGRLLVSMQDLLGVRWLQRRHRGKANVEEL